MPPLEISMQARLPTHLMILYETFRHETLLTSSQPRNDTSSPTNESRLAKMEVEEEVGYHAARSDGDGAATKEEKRGGEEVEEGILPLPSFPPLMSSQFFEEDAMSAIQIMSKVLSDQLDSSLTPAGKGSGDCRREAAEEPDGARGRQRLFPRRGCSSSARISPTREAAAAEPGGL